MYYNLKYKSIQYFPVILKLQNTLYPNCYLVVGNIIVIVEIWLKSHYDCLRDNEILFKIAALNFVTNSEIANFDNL